MIAGVFAITTFAADTNCEYKLIIKTQATDSAGTDDEVYVTIRGEGKEIRCTIDGKGDTLDAGKEDIITFSGPAISKIESIGFSKNGDDNWLMESCRLVGVADFAGNIWLVDNKTATDGDDVADALTLTPSNLVNYNVELKTGWESNAGTFGDVGINIIGIEGSTGFFYLKDRVSGSVFNNNGLDTFTLTGKDVGTITAIGLKCDSSDTWDPEYAKVNGTYYHCQEKLDKENPTVSLTSTKARNYNVQVKTGTYSDAGTDSNVYLTIFGNDNGTEVNTGRLLLNPLISGNAFENGDLDTILLENAKDVGEITKIKLEAEINILDDDWYAEYVTVDGMDFIVQQWVKEADENVSGSNEFKPGTKKDYLVTIVTDPLMGSGTDDDIYLIINGTKGSTPEVYLNGLISGNAFEAGDTDVVKLTNMPDIGDIVSITVRKDGNDDWYPHTIAVNEAIFAVFREVGNETFTNDVPYSSRQYTVTVQVSGASGAGTNDDIYIRIYGDKGETSSLLLDKVNYDDFEAGDKDTYTVWGQDVGTIQYIRLIWNNPNPYEIDDDVYIEYCEVDGLGFHVNRWFGSDYIFGLDVWPTELKDYNIKIQTGTFDDAGTDVGIWLNIIGKDGTETGYLYLNSYIDGNAFENGNLDSFILRTKDVGEIERILLRKYYNDFGWYLEYVEIDDYFFNAKLWFDDYWVKELTPDAGRYYDVSVQTGSYGSGDTDDDVLLNIFGTNGSTGVFRLNGYVEDEEFERGGLYTMKLKGLDVGSITHILVSVDGGDGWYLECVTVDDKTYPAHMWLEDSSAELKAVAVTTHYIKITTADKWLAGTDGDVYIELIGSDGQSTGKILLDEDGKNDFERNESFVYTLRNVKDVGTITKAILSLEDGDDWCVGSISIDNGEVYTYNHWLEEGEQITIDLTKGQTFFGSGFFSFSGFFGSMVSSGSIWIIVGIAVALAAAAVITVIVVKKRKKTAG